jgi:crotonobetainyl-CoA:carnitine CoA-transferase CaiB-like acyl-CoA transferase
MDLGCLLRLLFYILPIALLIFRPINNIAQTFAHPQSIARQVVTEVEVSLGQLLLN